MRRTRTRHCGAKWALAAYKQNKYFEFFKEMMQNHAPITDDLLEKTAKDVGMDVAKAKTDMASSDVLLQIERNRSLAGNMNIHGTPAFIVGTFRIPGGLTAEQFKLAIADARKAAKQSGTKAK